MPHPTKKLMLTAGVHLYPGNAAKIVFQQNPLSFYTTGFQKLGTHKNLPDNV
jgi:hypothetical protein